MTSTTDDAQSLIKKMIANYSKDPKEFIVKHKGSIEGVSNRTLFEDRLKQALAFSRRHNTKVAVLSVDLDIK